MIGPPQAHVSSTRAAGSLLINTVADPFTIGCGNAGVARSVRRAAGSFATRTVGQQGGMIGIGTGAGGGGAGGGAGKVQACKSVTRA